MKHGSSRAARLARSASAACRRLAPRSALALLAVSCAFVVRHASADWPPPEDATAIDMKDPLNWPNDPDYAWSEDSNGQWNYYSFDGRQRERAAGKRPATGAIHWRGGSRKATRASSSPSPTAASSGTRKTSSRRPSSTTALANHRPLHGDGSACGDLDATFYPGELPVALAGFDCNADGIVSASDFKDTPSLTPAADAEHPLGDRNRNGRFDAGDVIKQDQLNQ